MASWSGRAGRLLTAHKLDLDPTEGPHDPQRQHVRLLGGEQEEEVRVRVRVRVRVSSRARDRVRVSSRVRARVRAKVALLKKRKRTTQVSMRAMTV